jgi:TetR/AcrR family transcriptional repressor of nem operon
MNARQQILIEHFRAIHQQGFQATRTDRVVSQMGITKGAFYHYFPTKNHLGYALLDEIICPMYLGLWKGLEETKDAPLDCLLQTIAQYRRLVDEDSVRWGCILTNLIQEMTPVDAGFQERLTSTLFEIQRILATGIRQGQTLGVFRLELQPDDTAIFLIAALQGAFSMGKGTQSLPHFHQAMDQIEQWVLSWGAQQ